MNNLSERLERSAAALDLLEEKRNENAMTVEDYARENRILMTELQDLEEDMAPVRRRRRESSDPQ